MAPVGHGVDGRTHTAPSASSLLTNLSWPGPRRAPRAADAGRYAALLPGEQHNRVALVGLAIGTPNTTVR